MCRGRPRPPRSCSATGRSAWIWSFACARRSGARSRTAKYVASNFDRGLFVADPVLTGVNLREVGWYVAYVQEIARYGVVGFRVDSYNPNGDATRQLAGSLLPLDQTITTYSPLAGFVLPDRARLMFEYDHIVNHAGLAPSGVPASLPEDQWAVRLQVEM